MPAILLLLLFVVLALLIYGMVAPKKLASKIDKRGNRNLTRGHFGLGFGLLILALLILIGATAPKTATTKSVQLTNTTKSSPKVNNTQTKTVSTTKAVPFSSSTVNDSSLAKGTTKITTVGVNGVETLTYSDTYVNGKLSSSKLYSDVITTKPINQVTSVGTYVAPTPAPSASCTNGTYVNSEGNTVCSPETSSTVPAGATAQCEDGTYSFSQSHSGTCSHHGGVSSWL